MCLIGGKDKNKFDNDEINESNHKIKLEEAIIGLNKIFKKTITKPPIYYMPLAKEHV